MGSTVAVKLLYSQMMHGEMKELKDEVAMLSRMRHANTVLFYGVSVHEALVYPG